MYKSKEGKHDLVNINRIHFENACFVLTMVSEGNRGYNGLLAAEFKF